MSDIYLIFFWMWIGIIIFLVLVIFFLILDNLRSMHTLKKQTIQRSKKIKEIKNSAI